MHRDSVSANPGSREPDVIAVLPITLTYHLRDASKSLREEPENNRKSLCITSSFFPSSCESDPVAVTKQDPGTIRHPVTHTQASVGVRQTWRGNIVTSVNRVTSISRTRMNSDACPVSLMAMHPSVDQEAGTASFPLTQCLPGVPIISTRTCLSHPSSPSPHRMTRVQSTIDPPERGDCS